MDIDIHSTTEGRFINCRNIKHALIDLKGSEAVAVPSIQPRVPSQHLLLKIGSIHAQAAKVMMPIALHMVDTQGRHHRKILQQSYRPHIG